MIFGNWRHSPQSRVTKQSTKNIKAKGYFYTQRRRTEYTHFIKNLGIPRSLNDRFKPVRPQATKCTKTEIGIYIMWTQSAQNHGILIFNFLIKTFSKPRKKFQEARIQGLYISITR